MARGVKGSGPPRVRKPPDHDEPRAVQLARSGGIARAVPEPIERSAGLAFPISTRITPPLILDDIGAEEWKRIASLQEMFAREGLSWISEMDTAVLAAYCQAWSVWARSAAELNKKKRLIVDGKPIPELALERESRKALTQVAKDLGLASMVRARIQAHIDMSGKGEEEDDLLS